MRQFQILFKNMMRRMVSRKGILLISLCIPALVVTLVVYFTSTFEMKTNIAIVGGMETLDLNPDFFHVDRLDEAPPTSQLVRNRYSAIIHDQGDGDYSIETMKGESFKNIVQTVLTNPEYDPELHKGRSVGITILGYLTLFLLMQGQFYMNYFSEDKRIGILQRITATPIRIETYLWTQICFGFVMNYVPTLLVLIILKNVFQMKIGFSLIQYSWLLALIVLVATTFALFTTVSFELADNAIIFSSSVILITSLLSGCLYPMTHQDIIETFTAIFPQKQYLMMAEAIEEQTLTRTFILRIMYIGLFVFGLFIAATVRCQRKIKEG
ncbi:ABC transporter permease [Pseudogracilibacillus auburnensis]|uniref:ABC transporter permease n=1 Tax=Pseudogracilibacillus auburnensis TaxID=1494959 RepID=UPI001A970E41|nr:ABC transporter permease [Pseudogracilibacillus auburnensis]MBO1004088.1 ABC transporter permease [Pseudogracilibacillus auburnensis]